MDGSAFIYDFINNKIGVILHEHKFANIINHTALLSGMPGIVVQSYPRGTLNKLQQSLHLYVISEYQHITYNNGLPFC